MVVIHKKYFYRRNKISFVFPLFLSLLLIFIAVFFFSSWLRLQNSVSNENIDKSIILENKKGTVFFRTENELTFTKIIDNQKIENLSYIHTDVDSLAYVNLYDKNIIKLPSNTAINFKNITENNQQINLDRGNIWLLKIDGDSSEIKIYTPNTLISLKDNAILNVYYNNETKDTDINMILGLANLEVYQLIDNGYITISTANISGGNFVRINDNMFDKLKQKIEQLNIVKDDKFINNNWIISNIKYDYESLSNKKNMLKKLITSSEENKSLIKNIVSSNSNNRYKEQYYQISVFLKDLQSLINRISLLDNNAVSEINVVIKDDPNFLSPNNDKKVKYINYTVKEGDRLSLIAEKYNVTIDDILEANNIDDPNTILIGKVLKIPYVDDKTSLNEFKNNDLYNENIDNKNSNTGSNIFDKKNIKRNYVTDSNGYYTVKEGDTLFLIGEAFGINYKTLALINGLEEPYNIYVGQKLLISSDINKKVINKKSNTGSNFLDNENDKTQTGEAF